MKVIVGLGNPGDEYEQTRHNVGWMVLDALAEKLSQDEPASSAGGWQHDAKFEADVFEVGSGEARCLLLKPTTFMNNSGRSVERVRAFYKLESTEIIVVHDELDLPLGTVRIRLGGQTAGHNGVGSLIHHLGTDQFSRVRLGIETDHPERVLDTTGYVLDRFSADERLLVDKVIDQTVSHLVDSLSSGQFQEESFTIT